MKNQKGITLIALIITIIVMLILVGVSVTVALDGGLFETTKEATSKTQVASDKEQLLGAVMGGMTTNGKVDFTEVELPQGFTAETTDATTQGVKKETTRIYKNTKTGTEYIANERGSIGEKEYTIGEEITLGETETFYVIGEEVDKVILLAKNCIDTTIKKQSETADEVVFSNILYWSNVTDETKYPLNLNTYPIPDKIDETEVTSIITTAKEYGADLGGTGRLMTLEEVGELGGDIENLSTDGCPDFINNDSYYWLGSVSLGSNAYTICPLDDGMYDGLADDYLDIETSGVRPVVEISKSAIQ